MNHHRVVTLHCSTKADYKQTHRQRGPTEKHRNNRWQNSRFRLAWEKNFHVEVRPEWRSYLNNLSIRIGRLPDELIVQWSAFVLSPLLASSFHSSKLSVTNTMQMLSFIFACPFHILLLVISKKQNIMRIWSRHGEEQCSLCEEEECWTSLPIRDFWRVQYSYLSFCSLVNKRRKNPNGSSCQFFARFLISLVLSLSLVPFSRKHRTLDKNTSGNFTRQTSWSRWSRKGNRGGGVGSDKSEHNRVCHQRTTRYCMINISPGRTLPSACWFNKFAFLFLPLCVCVCAFSSSLLSIRWTFCATIWYN